MFIDCTGPRVQVDPDRYPSGLVIRTLALLAVGEVTTDFGPLTPKLTEAFPVHGQPCQRLTYSVTEHREFLALEEESYCDFRASSYFDEDESALGERSVFLSVTERADVGWVVEVEVEVGVYMVGSTSGLVVVMPRFSPTAVLFPPAQYHASVQEPASQPPTEEKPPGKPLWERLEDEG